MVYVLSLGGALAYGSASVLQQLAARAAPIERSMSLGLLTYLLRRKTWLIGIACDALGYGLQAIALNYGALSLVEPLFVSGLLFALPLGAAVRRRWMTPIEWAGAIAVTAGLAAFVWSTQPQNGNYDIPYPQWLGFGLVATAVMAFGGWVARTGRGAFQSVALGLGSGFVFSLGTALTKFGIDEWSHDGFVALLTTAAPYALVAIGIAGLLISQSSFQAGDLSASLPALTVSEPVVSALAGVRLFHEHVRGGLLPTTTDVIATLAITVGIIVLARQNTEDVALRAN